jgi:hypothetical protein
MVNPDRNLYDPPYDDALLYDNEMEPERPRSRSLVVMLAFVVLAAFAGVVWVAYNRASSRASVESIRRFCRQMPVRPASSLTRRQPFRPRTRRQRRAMSVSGHRTANVLPARTALLRVRSNRATMRSRRAAFRRRRTSRRRRRCPSRSILGTTSRARVASTSRHWLIRSSARRARMVKSR